MDNSYKNGKIYKIIDNTNGNFYVGSTNYVKLCSRLGKHRGYLKEYMNGSSQTYYASMEILINENYKILLLEPYPCKNRDELRMREQEWMDKLRCDKMVNKYNAYASKEDHILYKQLWHEVNKDRVNARKAEKVECPNCKSIVNRGDIARHKKSPKCLDFVEK